MPRLGGYLREEECFLLSAVPVVGRLLLSFETDLCADFEFPEFGFFGLVWNVLNWVFAFDPTHEPDVLWLVFGPAACSLCCVYLCKG